MPRTRSEGPPPSPHVDLEALSIAYTPIQVPIREEEYASIRDDVRRMLLQHNFQPSSTHFTSTKEMYRLYLSDTNQQDADCKQSEDGFRSALGRVLRPPESADKMARSYAVPGLLRWNGCVNLVSPDCKIIDPKDAVKKHKKFVKTQRLKSIEHDSDILELRQQRMEKKQSGQTNEEQHEHLTQHVSFRYVDEFISLNCAEDLLTLKIFPNGKELAESMSAYSTVRQYLHHHKPPRDSGGPLLFSDSNVLLVAVGDGVSPRTAALFAFRSSWQCVSIDPAMRSGPWDSVDKLTTYRARVQDIQISVQPHQRVVVVMWHCHTSLSDALGCLQFENQSYQLDDPNLRKRVAVVSCACCNFDQVQSHMPDGTPPNHQFEDVAVPGLMRTVRVWEFL